MRSKLNRAAEKFELPPGWFDQGLACWGQFLLQQMSHLSSSVAPASGVYQGAALAVHPMSGPALGLGPSSNVTPAGVGVPGVQPKAVDPTRRFGPRPKAKHIGRLNVDS